MQNCSIGISRMLLWNYAFVIQQPDFCIHSTYLQKLKCVSKWTSQVDLICKPKELWRKGVCDTWWHRGMNTRGDNWLLWKGLTVCRLICVLCHNFWTNYNLDLFSTSKWPSELQFCERCLCRWQKIGLKLSKNGYLLCSIFSSS